MRLFRARISVGPQSQFTVTVVTTDRANPVWNANILVSRELDDRMMWQGVTNEEGVASNLLPYIGDFQVRVRVRKAGFMPMEFREVLAKHGVDTRISMEVDNTYHFASYNTAFFVDTRAQWTT